MRWLVSQDGIRLAVVRPWECRRIYRPSYENHSGPSQGHKTRHKDGMPRSFSTSTQPFHVSPSMFRVNEQIVGNTMTRLKSRLLINRVEGKLQIRQYLTLFNNPDKKRRIKNTSTHGQVLSRKTRLQFFNGSRFRLAILIL